MSALYNFYRLLQMSLHCQFWDNHHSEYIRVLGIIKKALQIVSRSYICQQTRLALDFLQWNHKGHQQEVQNVEMSVVQSSLSTNMASSLASKGPFAICDNDILLFMSSL